MVVQVRTPRSSHTPIIMKTEFLPSFISLAPVSLDKVVGCISVILIQAQNPLQIHRYYYCNIVKGKVG